MSKETDFSGLINGLSLICQEKFLSTKAIEIL